MIFQGDALKTLKTLPDESISCCVTSPPYYGLRDYGIEGQLGQENTIEEYVENIVNVFAEVKRILKNDGTLWLNVGDSYTSGNRKTRHHDPKNPARHIDNRPQTPSGLKPKDLIGVPWRIAFALQAGGWYLRQDIIWSKPNPMPESVTDRCTKSHEYLFLLSKSEKYYFDQKAIMEPVTESSIKRLSQKNIHTQKGSARAVGKINGNMKAVGTKEKRNKRSVWTINTKPFKGAHFATFPPNLIEPCILAGSPSGGVILDPFLGSGTTLMVALSLGREGIGIELNPDYVKMAEERLKKWQGDSGTIGDFRIQSPT